MSAISEKLFRLLGQKRNKPIFHFKETLEFCLICGALRIDSDPTGLTCGQERCLAELSTLYFNHEESLKAFFLSQISSDALDPELKLKDLLQEMEDRITYFCTIIVDIARSLGWKEENIGNRLELLNEIESDISGDPDGGILTIFEVVSKIAKKLDIGIEEMSLREALKEIGDEIIRINEATERLTD